MFSFFNVLINLIFGDAWNIWHQICRPQGHVTTPALTPWRSSAHLAGDVINIIVRECLPSEGDFPALTAEILVSFVLPVLM